MGLFGSIGLDWKLLLAQMVNFGLLLWLLKKFLYKPVIARIEKDEHLLEKARVQARALEGKEKDFMREKKRKVAEAKEQAKEIIKEAENLAVNIKKQAQAEAVKEKRAVIRQIHARLKEIEDEKNDK